MSEDKKAAQKMAVDDLRATVKAVRDLGVPQELFSYEHGIPKDLPAGDGDGMIAPFIIGERGRLTKTAARKAGAMFRDMSARYPKAIFYLNLLGYDQDPREIWEVVDAARFVRWFARAAGLNDMATAEQIFGPGSPTWEAGAAMGEAIGKDKGSICGAIGFLAACGVFGDELKQHALRQLKPTLKQ
jgi:hypothetical protein